MGLRFALVKIGLFMAVTSLGACAPTDARVILKNVQTQLANQYHECVPLGWAPVPVAGTYYPGYSIEASDERAWLKALWIGVVRADAMSRPDVRATYDVLDQLGQAGLVVKRRFPQGFFYHLTMRAMPYYFDGNDFGNNPDHIPYLCYSRVVPDRVVRNRSVRADRVGGRTRNVFRAAFHWHASEIAAWAAGPLLRSHGVVLAPTQNPVVTKFVMVQRSWLIETIATTGRPVPRLADASAWPRRR